MSKKRATKDQRVTVSLTSEEKKVLIAISSNLHRKEASGRQWDDLATRFGFPHKGALKRFLLNELRSTQDDSGMNDGNESEH